jgi:hypothetical protein
MKMPPTKQELMKQTRKQLELELSSIMSGTIVIAEPVAEKTQKVQDKSITTMMSSAFTNLERFSTVN